MPAVSFHGRRPATTPSAAIDPRAVKLQLDPPAGAEPRGVILTEDARGLFTLEAHLAAVREVAATRACGVVAFDPSRRLVAGVNDGDAAVGIFYGDFVNGMRATAIRAHCFD
jgi:hypothetical protein